MICRNATHKTIGIGKPLASGLTIVGHNHRDIESKHARPGHGLHKIAQPGFNISWIVFLYEEQM